MTASSHPIDRSRHQEMRATRARELEYYASFCQCGLSRAEIPALIALFSLGSVRNSPANPALDHAISLLPESGKLGKLSSTFSSGGNAKIVEKTGATAVLAKRSVTARCADEPARRRGEVCVCVCVYLGHPVDARRSGQAACYRHRLLMKQVMSYWRVIDTDTCIRTADAAAIVNMVGERAGEEGGRIASTTRRVFTSRVFHLPNSLHSETEFRGGRGGAGRRAASRRVQHPRAGQRRQGWVLQNGNCSSGRP